MQSQARSRVCLERGNITKWLGYNRLRRLVGDGVRPNRCALSGADDDSSQGLPC